MQTFKSVEGGPSEYTMYGQEIGNTSLLHGMIALTIFAKTKDVESGAFNLVDAQVGKLSNGVNLVVTKVPNKVMAAAIVVLRL